MKIGGSKNAALPLIAAAILAPGEYTITNVPPITDIRTMCRLLRMLGAEGRVEDEVLKLDTSAIDKYEAPYELVKTMRASIYVLGPLLARFGKAMVSLPGGCAWGPRPVNLHIEGMKKLGAEIVLDKGYIVAQADRLQGAEIELNFPSVGATGNILMAAVKAEGETIISNAAYEPDITVLAEFLQKMGADISGIGTPRLVIRGVEALSACDYDNIPDRIEAGTFMIAGAITGGDVALNNCRADHCEEVIGKLRSAGCEIETGRDSVRIKSNGELTPVDVITAVYPGYPTDLQAQWIALMTMTGGVSRVTEGVYFDRFTHVAELIRLGADISMDGSTAIVRGTGELLGAQVMSTDIRASASLILAGLAAKGRTEVSRIYHIDRGYYKIEEKLTGLGAEITREEGSL